MKIFTEKGLTKHNEKLWSDWHREQNIRLELDEIHREIFNLRQRIDKMEDPNSQPERYLVNVEGE
jgi:hypothetical protein